MVPWTSGYPRQRARGRAGKGRTEICPRPGSRSYPRGDESRDQISTQTNPPAPLAQEPEWTLAEIQGMEAPVRNAAASRRAGNTFAASATPFYGHSDRAR